MSKFSEKQTHTPQPRTIQQTHTVPVIGGDESEGHIVHFEPKDVTMPSVVRNWFEQMSQPPAVYWNDKIKKRIRSVEKLKKIKDFQFKFSTKGYLSLEIEKLTSPHSKWLFYFPQSFPNFTYVWNTDFAPKDWKAISPDSWSPAFTVYDIVVGFEPNKYNWEIQEISLKDL